VGTATESIEMQRYRSLAEIKAPTCGSCLGTGYRSSGDQRWEPQKAKARLLNTMRCKSVSQVYNQEDSISIIRHPLIGFLVLSPMDDRMRSSGRGSGFSATCLIQRSVGEGAKVPFSDLQD